MEQKNFSDPDDKPSKSQKKRDMQALQKLGEALVKLSAAELEKLPLSELLLDSIKHAQTITSHEGKRRQLQYIGKVMRDVDPLPIEEALEKLQWKQNQAKVIFHQVERWRDQLITEGDEALAGFINRYPQADHQQLRQLIRAAQQNKPGAERLVFQYIRQIIEAQ